MLQDVLEVARRGARDEVAASDGVPDDRRVRARRSAEQEEADAFMTPRGRPEALGPPLDAGHGPEWYDVSTPTGALVEAQAAETRASFSFSGTPGPAGAVLPIDRRRARSLGRQRGEAARFGAVRSASASPRRAQAPYEPRTLGDDDITAAGNPAPVGNRAAAADGAILPYESYADLSSELGDLHTREPPPAPLAGMHGDLEALERQLGAGGAQAGVAAVAAADERAAMEADTGANLSLREELAAARSQVVELESAVARLQDLNASLIQGKADVEAEALSEVKAVVEDFKRKRAEVVAAAKEVVAARTQDAEDEIDHLKTACDKLRRYANAAKAERDAARAERDGATAVAEKARALVVKATAAVAERDDIIEKLRGELARARVEAPTPRTRSPSPRRAPPARRPVAAQDDGPYHMLSPGETAQQWAEQDDYDILAELGVSGRSERAHGHGSGVRLGASSSAGAHLGAGGTASAAGAASGRGQRSEPSRRGRSLGASSRPEAEEQLDRSVGASRSPLRPSVDAARSPRHARASHPPQDARRPPPQDREEHRQFQDRGRSERVGRGSCAGVAAAPPHRSDDQGCGALRPGSHLDSRSPVSSRGRGIDNVRVERPLEAPRRSDRAEPNNRGDRESSRNRGQRVEELRQPTPDNHDDRHASRRGDRDPQRIDESPRRPRDSGDSRKFHQSSSALPPAELPRRRESDKVEVPRLPSAPGAEDWSQRLEGHVVAAASSPDPRVVMRWLSKCREKIENVDEVLSYDECPQVFRSLDSKLCIALKERILDSREGGLKFTVRRLADAAKSSGDVLTGRRVLYEVLQYFSISDGQGVQRATIDLCAMEFPKGEEPEKIELWANAVERQIRLAIREGLSESSCFHTLREKLRTSKKLEAKVEAWENANPYSASQRWDKLLGVVFAWVRRWQNDCMRAEVSAGLHASYQGRSSKPAAAVEAVPQSSKPKGKGKGAPVTDWRPVFDKYKHVCRDHVVNKACERGDQCPHSHAALSKAQTAELRAAMELRDSQRAARGGSRTPRGDSPAGSPVSRARSTSGVSDDMCFSVGNGTDCTRGDNCRWKHADTAAEQARIDGVRARKGSGKGKSKPAAAAASGWAPALSEWS